MASTARRGGARRRSHGWTTGKRRRRTPSPELEPDAVEEEVEEYLRRKWIPGDNHMDWTAGDWWRANKHQFLCIEKVARHLLATQVTCCYVYCLGTVRDWRTVAPFYSGVRCDAKARGQIMCLRGASSAAREIRDFGHFRAVSLY